MALDHPRNVRVIRAANRRRRFDHEYGKGQAHQGAARNRDDMLITSQSAFHQPVDERVERMGSLHGKIRNIDRVLDRGSQILDVLTSARIG